MKNISILIALFCSIQLIGSNINIEKLKFSNYKVKTENLKNEKFKPNAMTVTVTTDTICSGGSTIMKAKVSGSTGSFKYVWTVPSGITNPGNVRSFTTSTVGDYSVVVTNLNTNEVGNGSGSVRLSSLPNASTVIKNYCGSFDATNKTRYMDWGPNVSGISDWHYTYSVNGGVPVSISQKGGLTSYNAPSPNSSDVIQMVLYPKGTVCHQKLEWACPRNNPVINTVTDKIGCSGTIFNQIDFTTSANSSHYDGVIWTNDNPNIGLASSGNTMFIPSFTAANVTQPITANISVVLTKLGTEVYFDGQGNPIPPITFKITINPLPTASISGSTTICSGKTTTINFTGTPNAIITYKATGGTNQTLTLNTSGTATLTTPILTTNTNYDLVSVASNTTPACIQNLTGSAIITVSPGPVVSISDVNICSGQSATVTATTASSGTYVWTVPSGVTNPGNVSTFTTSTEGTYSVVLTTSSGCISNASGKVTVGNLPSISISSTTVCEGESSKVTATTLPNGLVFSYLWTVPTGATNPGNVTTFNTNVAGNYSVVVTETLSGCSNSSIPVSVIFNTKPGINLNADKLAICKGSKAKLTATPSSTGTFTYTWTVPNGFTNPGNVASFETSTPGVYSVTSSNTTSNCISDVATLTITELALPTVTVESLDTTCVDGINNATISATASNDNVDYNWTVPNGVTNPGNVKTFNSNIIGNYSVIVTDKSTLCKSLPNNTTASVTLNPLPDVTVNSATICIGASTNILASVTPVNGTYTYVWTVPTGETNPGNVKNFSAKTEGNYGVIVTDNITKCSRAIQYGVITVSNPTVSINSDILCADGTIATINASVSSNNINYNWNVPSTVINPGNVGTIFSQTAGNYSVTITDKTTNCSKTSNTITINALPTVTVTSKTICNGDAATIAATVNPSTGIYSYVWTVPNGVTNPGNVSSFSSSIAGDYSVIATNTTTTCSSILANGTITTTTPNVSVSADKNIKCKADNVELTATPSIPGTYNYVWTVPTGATSPGNSPSFTTSIAGTYTVKIIDTVLNCNSNTATITISNHITPSVVLNDLTICEGETAMLEAKPTVNGTYDYTWTVPIGVTDPGNVSSLDPIIAGTYSVIIIDPLTTCSSISDSGIVKITPKTIINLTNNTQTICSDVTTSIPLTSNNLGSTYSWTVVQDNVTGAIDGNGNKISQKLTATGTTPGTAIYTIVPTFKTCVGESLTFTITVNPNPDVTVTSPIASICSGETVNIPLSSSLVGTTFDFVPLQSGATGATSGTGDVINQTFNTTGNSNGRVVYSITPKLNSCNGVTSKVTVTVNSLPNPILKDGAICVDQVKQTTFKTFTLNTGLNAANYTFAWTLDAIAIPDTSSSIVTSKSGTFGVIATNKTTNCKSEEVKALVRTTYPSTSISVVTTPAFEDTAAATVIVSGGNGTYEYQLDLFDFQLENVFSGLPTGPHTIKVKDNDGCTNLSKDFFIVGYPKYFTPNGDGIHDLWNIDGLEILNKPVIYIYNRYGKLIKQILTSNDSWDGTFNNEVLESTDYWFTIDYTDLDNNPKVFKSHFSLKR